MIERTQELKVGCKQDVKSYEFIVYADFIASLAPSMNGLQILIDNVSEFLEYRLNCV